MEEVCSSVRNLWKKGASLSSIQNNCTRKKKWEIYIFRKHSTVEVLAARSNLYGVSARQRRVLPGTTQISYTPPLSPTHVPLPCPSIARQLPRRRRPPLQSRAHTHTHTLAHTFGPGLCVCEEGAGVGGPSHPRRRRRSVEVPKALEEEDEHEEEVVLEQGRLDLESVLRHKEKEEEEEEVQTVCVRVRV